MLELDEIIWQIIASIPEGSVATYGQVAMLAGYPNHARYVGTTLKKLPTDTCLPWHRVVNAKGKLSFPEGSKHYLRQKSLLESEGIQFKENQICLNKFSFYKNK